MISYYQLSGYDDAVLILGTIKTAFEFPSIFAIVKVEIINIQTYESQRAC